MRRYGYLAGFYCGCPEIWLYGQNTSALKYWCNVLFEKYFIYIYIYTIPNLSFAEGGGTRCPDLLPAWLEGPFGPIYPHQARRRPERVRVRRTFRFSEGSLSEVVCFRSCFFCSAPQEVFWIVMFWRLGAPLGSPPGRFRFSKFFAPRVVIDCLWVSAPFSVLRLIIVFVFGIIFEYKFCIGFSSIWAWI